MVDRPARDHIAAALEAYLEDKITAFELDERLDTQSSDKLVGQIASLVWCYYDDCTDHQVHLAREEWDLFQRLLMLLRSDVELADTAAPSVKRWEFSHRVAFACLLLYGLLAQWVGWNVGLQLLALPFGVPALLLWRGRARCAPRMSAAQFACYPFASWADLRSVRRNTSSFVKRRYRKEIGHRVVRGPGSMRAGRIMGVLCGLLLSPLLLLDLALPSCKDPAQPWLLKRQ